MGRLERIAEGLMVPSRNQFATMFVYFFFCFLFGFLLFAFVRISCVFECWSSFEGCALVGIWFEELLLVFSSFLLISCVMNQINF
jgi:hypothetical protein